MVGIKSIVDFRFICNNNVNNIVDDFYFKKLFMKKIFVGMYFQLCVNIIGLPVYYVSWLTLTSKNHLQKDDQLISDFILTN